MKGAISMLFEDPKLKVILFDVKDILTASEFEGEIDRDDDSDVDAD